MVTVPLLADFAVRLAFGLMTALAFTSWRAVPLRFFRIQSQIALGILVLAAMAQATSMGTTQGFWLVAGAAGACYLATVSWGLGLPMVAMGLEVVLIALLGGWMALVSRSGHPGTWALAAADRGVSGILLGATMHSMLLGHYYLIAPAMTIAPLTRSLDLIVGALGARCILAGLDIWTLRAGAAATPSAGSSSDLVMLVMRWGMGVVGAGVSVLLARRTAAIRSTQSATGILYITTIFVLFGELAALIVGARGPAG